MKGVFMEENVWAFVRVTKERCYKRGGRMAWFQWNKKQCDFP